MDKLSIAFLVSSHRRWFGILSLGLWTLVTFQATLVGTFALRLVTGDPTLLPFELRQNLEANSIAFVLHTSFGGLALLIGPWQFISPLRGRCPGLHRWLGRAYVAACLISGLTAYSVALHTFAGPIAATGFLAMATAWNFTTSMGLAQIRRRQYLAHRQWMIRSYGLALSAVLLRLYLLIPLWLEVEDFLAAYRIITWVSWSSALILTEIYIKITRRAEPTAYRFQTASLH